MSDDATVSDLYEAFNRADVEGVLALVDEGVRWSTLDLTLQPRFYSSKAGVREFLTEVFESPREFAVEPDEVLTVDREVLAQVRLRAPAGRPGTGYPIAHLWTVGDDGLLSRHRLYLSREKAMSALSRRLATTEFPVDRASIRSYAEAVHDDNPVYRDVAAATAAGFDDLVAPPMFAAVYSAEAVWPEVLTMVPEGSGPIVHGGQELAWSRPVHAGDVITTHAWFDEAVDKRALEQLVFRSVSWNQHGREVVRGTWTILVTRR